MKKILKELGLVDPGSPKATFKSAYEANLIFNLSLWEETIKFRNLTVHTYDEDTADDVFAFLPKFSKELDNYLKKLEKYKS